MRATDHIEVPDGFTDKLRRIAKRVAALDPMMLPHDFRVEQDAIGEDFRSMFRRWP